MSMNWREVQFDGLVGPTHNYAGLATGNVASEHNSGSVSNPREAALQGLMKMRYVSQLGVTQLVFPPHPRPMLSQLEKLGFKGDRKTLLKDTYSQDPDLLASVYSASGMWTANAGTIMPSCDSGDGVIHITPANLIAHFHRSIEPEFAARFLRSIFGEATKARVHDALPATTRFSDEGAANHMRLAPAHGEKGLHVFVYGTSHHAAKKPQRYVARQQEEVAHAIARRHQIPQNQFLTIQQSPEAIDLGVFHNDVIAVSGPGVLLAHERAFVDAAPLKAALPKGVSYVEVPEAKLSVQEAVKTYFFNSQLLGVGDGVEVIAPIECSESGMARAMWDAVLAGDNPIRKVHYLDVRQSMRNGGGPACLRLRVEVSDAEFAKMHQGVVLTEALYEKLVAWVKKHYRDQMALADLQDEKLVDEVAAALAELEGILGLDGLYTTSA